MEGLKERVAYLRGLAEGLKIDESSNEGKVLKGILEVLGEFAEVVDEIDEDLAEVEDIVFEEFDDSYECEECDYDGDCDFCKSDDDELDGEYYEIECPVCHDQLVVEEEAFDRDDALECPHCHSEIDIDVPQSDCGCGHNHHQEK